MINTIFFILIVNSMFFQQQLIQIDKTHIYTISMNSNDEKWNDVMKMAPDYHEKIARSIQTRKGINKFQLVNNLNEIQKGLWESYQKSTENDFVIISVIGPVIGNKNASSHYMDEDYYRNVMRFMKAQYGLMIFIGGLESPFSIDDRSPDQLNTGKIIVSINLSDEKDQNYSNGFDRVMDVFEELDESKESFDADQNKTIDFSEYVKGFYSFIEEKNIKYSTESIRTSENVLLQVIN